MKNYFKLLDLLFSVSDCVAFEVEAYENIYFKISEGDVYKRQVEGEPPTYNTEYVDSQYFHGSTVFNHKFDILKGITSRLEEMCIRDRFQMVKS